MVASARPHRLLIIALLAFGSACASSGAIRRGQVAAQLQNPAMFHATLDALFAGENTPGLSPDLQAELDRPLDVRAGERVVDDQARVVAVGDLGRAAPSPRLRVRAAT